MTYGSHSADVKVVIDFIRSGQLLRNPRPPYDQSIKIINDIAEAELYREPPPTDDPSEAGWCWRDILDYAGECGSDLPSERFERLKKEGLIDSLGSLMSGEVLDELKRQLIDKYDHEDIMFMWEYLYWIIEYIAAFGLTLPFIVRLFEFFCLGGYPCGWDGNWPKGRLVVFFPLFDRDSGNTEILWDRNEDVARSSDRTLAFT